MYGGPRVLSEPVRVYWAGFESDTLTLQQNGWSLSAEQDVYRNTMRLAMRHDGAQMLAITEVSEWEYRDQTFRHRHHPLHMRCAREIRFVNHGPIDWKFKPIDAVPVYVETEIRSLEDMVHFAPALVRTQEIIIPEESVSDLLARIQEMQQPARTERLKQELRRSHDEGRLIGTGPQQKFHAQILSLVA